MTQTKGWDSYMDLWLRAANVTGTEQKFVVVDAFESEQKLFYVVEHDGERYKWQPNRTNMKIAKETGVKSPKDLVGKVITFRKVMATNPRTKQEVESLRIDSVT